MSWFPLFFRRKVRERRLDAELRFHLEMQIRDKVTAGTSPEEARRKTAIEFGGLEQIKERCREVGSGRNLETTLQDLRFGLRTLRRSPGFTGVALATLGVGIGANAAIFSFVDSVLLKPSPYPDAARIVRVLETSHGNKYQTSPLTYLDWAKQNKVFEHIAAEIFGKVILNGVEDPVQLPCGRVSAHYFDIFGIRPTLGRAFAEGEDQPGRDHVAIMSHALWASRFGSEPGVIGRTILLDGMPTTVIGVLPKGTFDRNWATIWRPLAFTPENLSRDYHWLVAYAMLKPGVTVAQARAQMAAIGERIARDYPNSNKDTSVAIDLFTTTVVWKDLRQSLHVLMIAVAIVLLIACANLANLTLARGFVREREVAIRAALGAGRWRLMRQLLTESLLLSSAGGALGVLVAYGGMAALKWATPAHSLPPTADVAIDGRVLAFTLGISVLTGIVVGLIPAIKGSRPDLTNSIKEAGSAVSAGRSLHGLHGSLIVAEVALAFVLLCGAGLLIRSFLQMQTVDTGFDATNVVTAQLPISDKRFPSGTECNLYLRQIIDRIDSTPGVRDAALTVALPMEGWGNGMPFQIVGPKAVDVANRPTCFFKQVTPSYFRTLRMRLAKGRLLSDHDLKGTQTVAVISESMAKTYFPNEDPVGKRILVQEIKFAKPQLGTDIPWEVVGVVFDEKVGGLGAEVEPGMYVSEEQSPQNLQYLVVRGAMDPAVLQRSIRAAVHEVDRDQVLDEMRTLEQIKANSMGSDRLRSSLLAIFAVMALLLSGMGLYGVISYSVAQRTREIGIRTALGATSLNIFGLVLRSGMALACLGLIIGIAGALGFAQLLASMLFEVGKYDPVTLGAVTGLLCLTALLACYIPAKRAMKVNPIAALRWE